jgi:diaminohydroxyphosphoribosylaminopyrimidine deaminase/5-amino-6-(5-phosphoribosylamino)uracil reductase
MLTLKLAETADGYAAGPAGSPRLLLTSESANTHVQMFRALHDAILVGSGTALADDPLLTVRLPGLEAAKPLRIVLDSKLALRATSRLAETGAENPTLILTSEAASRKAAERLARQGIEIVAVAEDGAGHLDLAAALTLLAQRGLTRIFCEGGPRLAASLMTGGFADEIILLTSAVAVEGQGVAALDPLSRAALADPAQYRSVEDRMLGPDRLRRYERLL